MAHLFKLSKTDNFLKCYRFENQIKKLSGHQVEEFLLVAKVSWLV